MRKSFIALFFGILFISLQVKSQNEPLAILLTWTEDPTTTISIDWHTAENQSQQLFFREKGKEKWEVESGKTHPFPFSDRFVHRTALAGLNPGASYELKFGKYDKVYFFNTMPANAALEPIRRSGETGCLCSKNTT